MNKTLRTALVCTLGLTATTAMAASDPEKGKAHFTLCATCHGQAAEGNQALNAPVNAGQDEWYVIRQLNNFRAGVRGADPKDIYGAQMRPMAMTLADDQAVEDVAAYVASLPTPTPAATLTGDVEAGKKAYVTCVACHGEKGEGNKSLNAPRLSKQFDWYLVRQIDNFKAGIRGAHAQDIYGQQMRPMAMVLATDEQVNNVAAYMATLE